MSSKVNLGPDVDLKKIAHSLRAEGYSGADCAALLREAGLAVLKESMSSSTTMPDTSTATIKTEEAPIALCINESHFQYAFDHVVPSVSRKDQARYDRMRDRMAHARSRGAVVSEVKDEEDAVVEEPNKKSSNSAALSGIKQDDNDVDTNMKQS